MFQQAPYDKINGTAPGLICVLVQGSADRLGEVLTHMPGSKAPMVPGYQLGIVDGKHLAASEKRLPPQCGFRGAALPGQSLVVSNSATGLAVDIMSCENGHARECTRLKGVTFASESISRAHIVRRFKLSKRSWRHNMQYEDRRRDHVATSVLPRLQPQCWRNSLIIWQNQYIRFYATQPTLAMSVIRSKPVDNHKCNDNLVTIFRP